MRGSGFCWCSNHRLFPPFFVQLIERVLATPLGKVSKWTAVDCAHWSQSSSSRGWQLIHRKTNKSLLLKSHLSPCPHSATFSASNCTFRLCCTHFSVCCVPWKTSQQFPASVVFSSDTPPPSAARSISIFSVWKWNMVFLPSAGCRCEKWACNTVRTKKLMHSFGVLVTP